MDEFLLGLLSDLPGPASFAGAVGTVLLLAGGGVFLLQRTAAGRAFVSGTGRLVSVLIAALLLVMVFLSALQILLRNAFDTGLLWIDPLLRHLTLLLAFTGAIVATGLKRHVQINVLGRLLRGTARRVGGALVAAASAIVCLALTHASLALLSDELAFGDTVFLGIPAWVVAAVFPLSFALLAFRFFYLSLLEIAGEAPRAGVELESHPG